MTKRQFVAIGLALAMAAVVYWRNRDDSSKLAPTVVPRRISARATPVPPTADDRKLKLIPSAPESLAQQLSRVLNTLRQGNQADIDAALAELDRVLVNESGNAESTTAAIVEFLRSGQDAVTGKGFVIGPGGILTEATSLRVYLLDKLGILARGNSSQPALTVAQEILQDFGSADEWAVALRNIAWFDPTSREFLQQRLDAMLHHPAWCTKPTNGMLESFDLIVHTAALKTIPELSRLVTVPDTPLARAASVALQRLAGSSSLALTEHLNQQPNLLATTPLVRADLFSRADLTIIDQRQQLETYLLRTDVTARERKKFYSALIQTGQFVSYNLVTPWIPPETPDQASARLGQLTQAVSIWLRDPRLGALHAELTALATQVDQISKEIAQDNLPVK